MSEVYNPMYPTASRLKSKGTLGLIRMSVWCPRYDLVKDLNLLGNSTGLSMSLSLALYVNVIKNSPQATGLNEEQFGEVTQAQITSDVL
eukprot:236775-Pyramimonas_sp.AAC.2